LESSRKPRKKRSVPASGTRGRRPAVKPSRKPTAGKPAKKAKPAKPTQKARATKPTKKARATKPVRKANARKRANKANAAKLATRTKPGTKARRPAQTTKPAPRQKTRTTRAAESARKRGVTPSSRAPRKAPALAREARLATSQPEIANKATPSAPVLVALPRTLLNGRGPKIIAVPRAAMPASMSRDAAAAPPVAAAPPAAVRARLALPNAAPAVATTSVATPHAGVRLGRLPPRDGKTVEAPASRARIEGASAIHLRGTTPRRTLQQERWRDVDRAAARLGVTVDTAFRKAVRALMEGQATLSTELRGTTHVVAALVAAQLLPETAVVVGAEPTVLSEFVEKLGRSGVSVLCLGSGRSDDLDGADLARVASGAIKIVFTTPKWLANDALLRALGAAGVSLVTVLDAQDASTFSRTFSPGHARLRAHLERLGRPPVFALAPGASSATRHDVTEAFFATPPITLEGPVVRPNVALEFRAARGEVRQRALVDAVQKLPRPMLVFCSTPRDVEAVHGALQTLGLPAHRYHEDLRTGVRAGEQLQFSMPGDRPVLVATSAFALGSGPDEDKEGVPLRYGRRTTKSDIRSFVRFAPPTSVEQLVDELSLIGRDGESARALVFYDQSDRPAMEAETLAARPSGEQILLLGKALEATLDDGRTVTTEELALKGRTSLRVVQSLAALLDGMGLVSCRDGWLRRLSPNHVLLRELRGLAERYATIRALDARRLGDVAELASHGGCRVEKLRRLLGDSDASGCGTCSACKGEAPEVGVRSPVGNRHTPVRRFTVATPNEGEHAASTTFHSDRRHVDLQPLTAKIADFR
jgi:ATP-dependent DNA helicase RecQ